LVIVNFRGAAAYSKAGADELVFLDITATKGIFAQKIKAESELSHEISDIRPAPRGSGLAI